MNTEQQPKNRMTLWLIGLIVFLAFLSLVEGGIILSMKRPGSVSEWASRIFPHRWLPTPKVASRQSTSDDRIVLLDSAQDIALIHDRINYLFSALDGSPSAAHRPAMSGIAKRPSSITPSPERLAQLQNEIDRIFEGVFNTSDMFSLPARLEHGWNMSGISSSMQLTDQGSNVLVQLDLPGVDASAIVITLQGRLLTVAVNQSQENHTARHIHGPNIGHAQHKYLETKLMLPSPVNADAAQALYREGVLRIEIPKNANKEPLVRTIPLM